MTVHQNYNIFVLTRCMAGPGAAAGAHFWPKNLHFFTLHLYKIYEVMNICIELQ